jgi:hypothetical protein
MDEANEKHFRKIIKKRHGKLVAESITLTERYLPFFSPNVIGIVIAFFFLAMILFLMFR